jgi:hypothetical protein
LLRQANTQGTPAALRVLDDRFDVGTADRAALPSTAHWSGYGVNVWSIPLTHIAIGTSGVEVQQADPFPVRQPAVRRH